MMLLILVGCSGKPDTVDITFDAGVGRFEDGESVFVLSIPSGSLITEGDIPTPMRSGYDFRGWYTDEAGTKKFNEDSPITSDLTLYAKWSRYYVDTTKSYTVTFTIDDEEIDTQTVKDGGYATEILEKKEDIKGSGGELSYSKVYAVSDWQMEGESFDFTTPITGNITLIGSCETTPSRYDVYDEDGLKAWGEAVESDTDLDCAIFADIELTDWEPIINQPGSNSFYGTLNGNNHKISGLTDTFIGYNNGTIKNLNFDVNISTGAQFGVILYNFGQIINCKVSGKISVTNNALAVGAISAYNNKDIIACHSDVAINITSTDVDDIGGIASRNQQNGTIKASYFTGSIKGTISNGYVGGIAATNNNIILACYSTGTLPTSGSDIGGIVASNKISGSITASYWSGDTATGVADGDGSGATQVDDSSWVTPMEAMNKALSDNSIEYEYVQGSGDVPLVIQPTA